MVNTELKLIHSNFKNGTWPIPTYATVGSAGIDFLAAIDSPIVINSLESKLIGTGLAMHILDEEFVLLMVPRSGTGCKKGIILGNTTGVIDSDYQGEIKMCVWNRNPNSVIEINPGDYIAQGLLIRKDMFDFKIVEEFSNITARGENGFGHTK